ncbi:MAG: DUF2281 domain-containing protein [Candidatus Competibacteraceae bacterium]|nr:DUF2281 domain-containing protein [Candidatus Competibacteraceae bacterium]
MQAMTLDEAKIHLLELVEAAAAGEEIFIRKDEDLSVRLVPCPTRRRKRRFGSAKGLIAMAPDFDAPLEDFKEYLE